MSHELAEKLGGLASRVSNLADFESGETAEELISLRDRLADLQLAVIIRHLNAEQSDYKAAMDGLNEAIDFIGEATGKLQRISRAIELAGRAAKLADRVVKTIA